jgi:hypothetical protein
MTGGEEVSHSAQERLAIRLQAAELAAQGVETTDQAERARLFAEADRLTALADKWSGVLA